MTNTTSPGTVYLGPTGGAVGRMSRPVDKDGAPIHPPLWHPKWVPPLPRPPRTWKQWLMPWTYPKLTAEQKWALKQFD